MKHSRNAGSIVGGRNRRCRPGLRASINNLELDLDMVLLTNLIPTLFPRLLVTFATSPGERLPSTSYPSFFESLSKIAWSDQLKSDSEEVVIDLGLWAAQQSLGYHRRDGLTPGMRRAPTPYVIPRRRSRPLRNPRPCWRTQRPTLECFPTGFR